jgi:hypothetical protein
MDATTALAELEEVAKKLEVEVVYEHLTGEGTGSGGLCKIHGRWRVIIERRSSSGERLSILARALCRFDLESHYLSPALRELVERYLPTDRRSRSLEAAAAPLPEPPPERAQEPEPAPEPEAAVAESGSETRSG